MNFKSHTKHILCLITSTRDPRRQFSSNLFRSELEDKVFSQLFVISIVFIITFVVFGVAFIWCGWSILLVAVFLEKSQTKKTFQKHT